MAKGSMGTYIDFGNIKISYIINNFTLGGRAEVVTTASGIINWMTNISDISYPKWIAALGDFAGVPGFMDEVYLGLGGL